jgi:hypothetical protein
VYPLVLFQLQTGKLRIQSGFIGGDAKFGVFESAVGIEGFDSCRVDAFQPFVLSQQPAAFVAVHTVRIYRLRPVTPSSGRRRPKRGSGRFNCEMEWLYR